MLSRIILIIVTVLANGSVCRAGVDQDKVLREIQFESGWKAVVIEGPSDHQEQVNALLPADSATTKAIGARSVRVEFRKGETSIVAAVRRYPIWQTAGVVQVVDAAVVLDRIAVIAMVGPDSDLDVWTVSISGGSITYVPGWAWSQIAISLPAKPGRISAKLCYDPKSLKFNLKVTDAMDDFRGDIVRRNTEFEFAPGDSYAKYTKGPDNDRPPAP